LCTIWVLGLILRLRGREEPVGFETGRVAGKRFEGGFPIDFGIVNLDEPWGRIRD